MFLLHSRRRAVAVLAVGVGLVTLMIGGATPAFGAPNHSGDTAASSSPPTKQRTHDGRPGDPSECNTALLKTSWGSTCFNSHGDYQWARDFDPNGLTVYANLQTSYEKYASRICVAGPVSENGGWCDWNVGEKGCVTYSMVETDGLNYYRQSGWSAWYNAKTGAPESYSNCDK